MTPTLEDIARAIEHAAIDGQLPELLNYITDCATLAAIHALVALKTGNSSLTSGKIAVFDSNDNVKTTVDNMTHKAVNPQVA